MLSIILIIEVRPSLSRLEQFEATNMGRLGKAEKVLTTRTEKKTEILTPQMYACWLPLTFFMQQKSPFPYPKELDAKNMQLNAVTQQVWLIPHSKYRTAEFEI